MKPATSTAKWMERGIAESTACRKAFSDTKLHAMYAGHAFAQARQTMPGEFVDYLATFSDRVSKTTVYRYIEFYEAALNWAAEANPQLRDDPEALFRAATSVVLQSPKPFIALMRQLGDMRKFGEYDAVKYATKKLAGASSQIEFDFDKVFSAVDLLAHIGEDNYVIKYPENKDETEALRELRDKMAASVKRLDQIIEHGRVVEI